MSDGPTGGAEVAGAWVSSLTCLTFEFPKECRSAKDGDCVWEKDEGVCLSSEEAELRALCSEFERSPACWSTDDCVWDKGACVTLLQIMIANGTAFVGAGDSACPDIEYPETCRGTAGCDWDKDEWACAAEDPACSDLEDPKTCADAAGCDWDKDERGCVSPPPPLNATSDWRAQTNVVSRCCARCRKRLRRSRPPD